MIDFFQSLTDEEHDLLAKACFDYADSVSEGAGIDSGNLSHWRNNTDFEFVDRTIDGEVVSIPTLDRRQRMKMLSRIDTSGKELMNGSRIIYRIAASETPNNSQVDDSAFHESFSAISLNRFQSSDLSLFDHPAKAHSAFSMEIKDAEVRPPMAISSDYSWDVRPTTSTLKILLSEEQYVRMIRGEYLSTPCTISRSFGYLHDAPDNKQCAPIQMAGSVETQTQDLIDEIKDDVLLLCRALQHQQLNSKKRLALLVDQANDIDHKWQSIEKRLTNLRLQTSDAIRAHFMEQLIDLVEDDLNRLPDSDRHAVYSMLSKL